MAYTRKLPSGKWQATVRGPDGRKHTKTDPLKKVVKDWAAEEETKIAQGRWRDPRAGRIPLRKADRDLRNKGGTGQTATV